MTVLQGVNISNDFLLNCGIFVAVINPVKNNNDNVSQINISIPPVFSTLSHDKILPHPLKHTAKLLGFCICLTNKTLEMSLFYVEMKRNKDSKLF